MLTHPEGAAGLFHLLRELNTRLAWLLHQPQVTSVIIGAKRAEQLADNIGATRVMLSAEELARIGNASSLPAEYPGWMLERQGEYRRKQMAQAGAE